MKLTPRYETNILSLYRDPCLFFNKPYVNLPVARYLNLMILHGILRDLSVVFVSSLFTTSHPLFCSNCTPSSHLGSHLLRLLPTPPPRHIAPLLHFLSYPLLGSGPQALAPLFQAASPPPPGPISP